MWEFPSGRSVTTSDWYRSHIPPQVEGSDQDGLDPDVGDPAPPLSEDREAGRDREQHPEEPHLRMSYRHLVQDPAARKDQVQGCQDQHIGQRGAEEIPDADVRQVKERGVDVGEDLGNGGAGSEQHGPDPESTEARLLRDGVRLARQA